MTFEEYLTNYKKRGGIVYKCRQCDFRGVGAATFYHEMSNPTHQTFNEDNNKDANLFVLAKDVKE